MGCALLESPPKRIYAKKPEPLFQDQTTRYLDSSLLGMVVRWEADNNRMMCESVTATDLTQAGSRVEVRNGAFEKVAGGTILLERSEHYFCIAIDEILHPPAVGDRVLTGAPNGFMSLSEKENGSETP